MNVLDAIRNREAVREYSNKPVPREVLSELITYAQQAPNSCNLQTIYYVIVDDENIKKKLARVATRKIDWAPTSIFFFVDSRFSQKRSAAIVSLGASMQNIALASLNYGLATCPIAGFDGDQKIKKILGVPNNLEPVLIMSVGYPCQEGKGHFRVASSQVFSFNSFNSEIKLLESEPNLRKWSIDDVVNYRERIAPVYRYQNRFRLHTYLDDVYENSAYYFVHQFDTDNLKILDLFTFDGLFVKSFRELREDHPIDIADYLPYTNEVNKEVSGGDTFVISKGNDIPVKDSSYQFITCVQKLQFTPDRHKLIQEMRRILKSNGRAFIAVDQEPVIRRLGRQVRKFMRTFLLGLPYNVYENNDFYKIGPYSRISSNSLDNLFTHHGFEKVSGEVVEVVRGGTKQASYYGVYAKK